jgi:hypothetical protein
VGVVAELCDNGEEGGDELYELENELEVFRPTVGPSSSDVALSRNVELSGGADEGDFGADESTESAYGKESVESVEWERWEKEADRGETRMGGKSAREAEREAE